MGQVSGAQQDLDLRPGIFWILDQIDIKTRSVMKIGGYGDVCTSIDFQVCLQSEMPCLTCHFFSEAGRSSCMREKED